MHLARDRGDVVDRADDVRAVGEADEARAGTKQRLERGLVELAGRRVDPPFADDQPVLGEPAPGAVVGFVVEVGDDDFVARLEPMPDRLRQEIDVERGRGSDHHLVGLGIDHLGHEAAAGRDAALRLGRGSEIPGRLDLQVAHVGAEAVDDALRDVAAAGVLQHDPAVGERRELAAHEIDVELGHGGPPTGAFTERRDSRGRSRDRSSRRACPRSRLYRIGALAG